MLFFGLIALLLLPGILVVRAPWTAVPFLSLYFWIASWWWLPAVGRERFVGAALLAFVLGGVLRLLRPDVSRPAWPTLVALAAALLHAMLGLAPGAGARAPFDPVPAQLMVWHDGLPQTYVPLREAGSFGAHPHGLDAVAADLSRLCGLVIPRAVTLTAAVARVLSSIGLYSLLVRLFAPGPAALITLGASLIAGLIATLTGAGDPASFLGLGFALAAVGMLGDGRSRSAAVAAGSFVGAALMTAPAAAGAVLAAGVVAAAFKWRRASRGTGGSLGRRMALASLSAVATVAPFLVRVVMALGPG